MDNKKIVEKIKKLLALASSNGNENEGKSAMLKAKQLMMQHSLSEFDVNSETKKEIKVKELDTNILVKRSVWIPYLASIISENYRCYTYSRQTFVKGNKNYSLRVCFLGEESDVEICNNVFDYAIATVKSEIEKLKKQYRKEGKSVRNLENTYGVSFCEGLIVAFANQKEEHSEWGLVIVKPQEVENKYDSLVFSSRKRNSSYTSNRDENLKSKAYNDGKNFTNKDRLSNSAIKEA